MAILLRLEKLRQSMADAGVDAYIITGSDPHGNETPPTRWHTREWISGFTGSGGTVVVTADTAGLWTDFRYWIQASLELDGSGIELFHADTPGTPQPYEWLVQHLDSGAAIAFDGHTVSFHLAEKWERAFSDGGLRTDASRDFLADIWDDRPPLPMEPVIELSEDESGESRRSRLERLRGKLQEADADTWIGTALDVTAWLLNVRGGDVPYTPLVFGYLIVRANNAVWYTNQKRLPPELTASLKADGVDTAPYEDFAKAAASLPPEGRILIDPQWVNYSVVTNLPPDLAQCHAPDPVVLMKARKNPVELAHIRHAMEKDGVVMVRFFIDLERRLAQGERIGEVQAIELLRQHRKSLPGFLGESFSTIAAVGAHAALCHYEARAESQNYLDSAANLFLLDCGCQWKEGTTDITRTVTFNKPSKAEIQDYTRVLKAHITLSRLRFPADTRGYQLDAIARSGLWRDGVDYGHGTGHGVGFRLSVHEGPLCLGPQPVDTVLEPGMVVSNEPGIYREGLYGIRIENLLLCREDEKTEFGEFLSFETLSLAPYQRDLIDTDLLDLDEIRWLNEYHAMVRDRLSPLLEADEVEWLRRAASPVEGC